MPQQRDNPFPYPTAEEVEAATGDPAIKAARNVVSRHIDGIPKRAYVLGDNDTAPVVLGVADLTGLVYVLLNEIDRINEPDPLNNERAGDLDPDGFGSLVRLGGEVRTLMEDHRCPTAPPSE